MKNLVKVSLDPLFYSKINSEIFQAPDFSKMPESPVKDENFQTSEMQENIENIVLKSQLLKIPVKIDYKKVTKYISDIENLLIIDEFKNKFEILENISGTADFNSKNHIHNFQKSFLRDKHYSIDLPKNELKVEKNNNLKEFIEINKKNKEECKKFIENNKQKTSFEKWKGKYLPKDVSSLKKILLEKNVDRSIKTSISSQRKNLNQCIKNNKQSPEKNFIKNKAQTFRSFSLFDQNSSVLNKNMIENKAESPKNMKTKYLHKIFTLKRQAKVKAKLDLSSANHCFAKNKDKFNGKRFKRNPRFAIWVRPENKKEKEIIFPENVVPAMISHYLPRPISRRIKSSYSNSRFIEFPSRFKRNIFVPQIKCRPNTADSQNNEKIFRNAKLCKNDVPPISANFRKKSALKTNKSLSTKCRTIKSQRRSIGNLVNMSEFVKIENEEKLQPNFHKKHLSNAKLRYHKGQNKSLQFHKDFNISDLKFTEEMRYTNQKKFIICGGEIFNSLQEQNNKSFIINTAK